MEIARPSLFARLPPPPLDVALRPLDRARRAMLGVVAWLPRRARSIVVERDRRVAVLGAVLVSGALVATGLLPMWLLALGPIVWGVPHLVADVRYLVTRPGFHRRPLVLAPMFAGIVAAGLGLGVRGAILGAAGSLALSRGSIGRRALGLAVLGVLFAVAVRVGTWADVVYAHAHNAIAVALWWAWRPRATRAHAVTLAIYAAGSALILAGALDPIARWTGGFADVGTLTADELAAGLAPAPFDGIASRLLLLYAFGQSVHYIVWLRLIPEDDRPSPTPRSFTQSYRALSADVGSIVLWLAATSAVVFAVWAAFDVGRARMGYLQVGFFHGYLELAAAAVLWAETSSGLPEAAGFRRRRVGGASAGG